MSERRGESEKERERVTGSQCIYTYNPRVHDVQPRNTATESRATTTAVISISHISSSSSSSSAAGRAVNRPQEVAGN